MRFTESEKVVAEKTDKEVMVACVQQKANERNKLAVELRDKGEIQKAKEVLTSNAEYLRVQVTNYKLQGLEDTIQFNDDNAVNVENDVAWSDERKRMRQQQVAIGANQRYGNTALNTYSRAGAGNWLAQTVDASGNVVKTLTPEQLKALKAKEAQQKLEEQKKQEALKQKQEAK